MQNDYEEHFNYLIIKNIQAIRQSTDLLYKILKEIMLLLYIYIIKIFIS